MSHACIALAVFILTVALCIEAFDNITDSRIAAGGFYQGGKHYQIRTAP